MNNKRVSASYLPIITLLILLILLASLMDLLNPFATKIKRKGESGKPCLNPLEDLNKFNVDPLIDTTKESVVTPPIIHLKKEMRTSCELRLAKGTTMRPYDTH
jgi:hypothetical protein